MPSGHLANYTTLTDVTLELIIQMLLPMEFRQILEILRAPQNALGLPAKINGGMVSPCRVAARGFFELMRSVLLTFLMISILGTGNASADQFKVFRETWTDFVESCEAVFADLESFKKENQDTKGYKIKESNDKKAIAINVGQDGNYLTVFVDHLDRKSVISCERYNEKYGSFNAKKLANYLTKWMSEDNGFEIGGGFVPLYDNTTYQFGVVGVFADYEVPVRIRLFDGSIQFYSELVQAHR